MKKVASDERRVLKASDLPKSVLGSAPSITVVFDNCVALRQESLATFVRTLEGVNTMAIKGDLADLGYLYRTVGAGKYRVYASVTRAAAPPLWQCSDTAPALLPYAPRDLSRSQRPPRR